MSGVNFAYPVNTLWMLSCRRDLRAFRRSVLDVEDAQSQILQDIISANRDAAWGREHHFAKIRHSADFRELVPISDDQMVQPWIDRICEGQDRVLTTEPVRLLEPTSGSVSGRRLIPYTDSLRRQFQNGINPWIADLFSSRPALRRGRAYWMISPPMEPQQTSGGLTIGFTDDTQYLGPAARMAARHVMAVPPWTMRGVPAEEAPYQTLLRLVTVPDLALISVWSPTLLTNLIRLLERSRDRLTKNVRSMAGAKAAARVESILGDNGVLPDKLATLWPQLSLISCWADSSAAHSAQELHNVFPHVEIQAKGLISTEAFVSLPMIGRQGSALSVRSHFFEFQPSTSTGGDTLLANELSAGERYRVIVTTGGGLYRYQTHDVVEVTGFLEQCPLLRFCGRDNKTSDLVGEKLSEVFVASSINRMAEKVSISPTFAMLVPQRNPLGYRLLMDLHRESDRAVQRPSAQQIAVTLEHLLAENPYYRHAIQVGQLAPLRITLNESQTNGLRDAYESKCLNSGMRRGDIKPTTLDTRFNWEENST